MNETRKTSWWLTLVTMVAVVIAMGATSPQWASAAESSIDLSAASGDVAITEGGTWTLTGTLEGGVAVDVGTEDITLVLDGVDINNADGPAIAILSAGSVTIETAANSVNTVVDGEGTEEMDATIWAETNITFTGEGTLDITAWNEGVETTADIVVESGTILVHAADDGLNANTDNVSQITINGGTLFVETTAGDAIDSNGGIDINGGTVIAYGSMVDGNSGLDADGPVVINGGTVIASSGQMMVIDESSQQSSLWASFDGTLAAGTGVVVQNGEDVVVAVVPTVELQGLYISTPDLDPTAANQLFLGGTFEVDSTSQATGTITDAGTAGGTLSESNPGGGMRGRP